MAELDLLPLIEKRNAAVKACYIHRTRKNTKTVKECRKAIKKCVKKAKNDWITQTQGKLSFENASHNTKQCWDAVKNLKKGLSKTRTAQITKMKNEDGPICTNAEQNAQVFL